MGFGVLENNRLVKCYFAFGRCALKSNFTEADFKELENILNEAQPKNDTEKAQYQVVRLMYRSNPVDFNKLIYNSTNLIKSFVLWTDVNNIVYHFELKGRIHIQWKADGNGGSCKVVAFVPKELREQSDNKENSQVSDNKENSQSDDNEKPEETTNEKSEEKEDYSKFKMRYDSWNHRGHSRGRGTFRGGFRGTRKGLDYTSQKYRQANKAQN